MRYMASDATSAGEATIRIYFEPGTDPNLAVVNVQNRVNIVMNRLPPLVQREGILVSQIMPSMLMKVNIFSTDKSVDQKFLYNFASRQHPARDQADPGHGPRQDSRQPHLCDAGLAEARPHARYKMSSEDVMKALAEQSVIGSPGRLGQATGKTSQSVEYVLTYQGRYNKPEQYANIILKANPDGRDPAAQGRRRRRAGLRVLRHLLGHRRPSFGFHRSQAKPRLQRLRRHRGGQGEARGDQGGVIPSRHGLSSSPTTFPDFLDASIEKVLHTLLEAFVLVALVVYLFLGDWRSTLIPTLAVPVSLIGAFLFMQLLGLSINLITLFALVLAIGIVVDNAIVVVEAVHVKMHEKHLSPYRATMEVIHEISGAIIAITLVMTAVFVPVTFMTGPVGVFYRQFAITMATSIVLSGVVALTLTPVLCAMILKPLRDPKEKRGLLGRILYSFGIFLRLFDRGVEKVTGGYAAVLRRLVPRRLLTLLVIAGFSTGIYFVNIGLPPGFIPNEDQGILYGIIQTPPGSTLEYTNAKSHELQEIAKEIEGVTSVTSLAGYEVLTEGRGSNAGTCIINLKPWSERKRTARQIIEELEEKCRQITNVKLEFFEPPAVPGFGAAGGFSMRLLDKTNSSDYKRLGEVTEHLHGRPVQTQGAEEPVHVLCQ